MTPDQIRQIAEEYADSFGDDLDYRNDPCYSGHVAEAEDVLEWLTEHYCVVEKSKVVGEMKGAQWLKETSEGMDDASYTKGMAYGQTYILESLFGSETFNK